MNRNAYFFMLDAFMAISVIIIGLILILTSGSYRPYPIQTMFLAEDVMNVLSTTMVYEINNVYVKNLTSSGTIANQRNTLLEQINEFYEIGKTELAVGFAEDVTFNVIPEEFGFEIRLDSSNLNITVNNGTRPQQEARLLITSKRIVSGTLNNTIMWGPSVSEVRVWQ